MSAVGNWFVRNYVRRFRTADTGDVARQMRKQGIPLEVALAIFYFSEYTK